MTIVDTSWVKDLVDELDSSAVVKYDSEPLLSLLGKLAGDNSSSPVENLVEVGEPVPETDRPLGDFSPRGGGI